jgi:KDO2-lipid IV(A) lauroyltransferase
MALPTLRHRIEHLAYRVALGGLTIVPERIAFRVGEGIGWAAGFLLRIRWKTVRDHLRHAFPQETEAWRNRVARASYRHLGRESVATFRWARSGPQEIRERTEVVGLETLQAAVAEGRGVVLVTGHFGNWEIGGASLAAWGIPMDVIARRQRNPLFDHDINRAREQLKMRVMERSGAIKQILRSLREGRVVAFVGDQNVRRGGVFVDFLGQKAATARGAAFFALRAGCPFIVAFIRRQPSFPQRYRLIIQRLPCAPTGNMEEDVLRLTKAHTYLLEEQAREHPEQYFWQHRRWKTRPPGEEVGADQEG